MNHVTMNHSNTEQYNNHISNTQNMQGMKNCTNPEHHKNNVNSQKAESTPAATYTPAVNNAKPTSATYNNPQLTVNKTDK